MAADTTSRIVNKLWSYCNGLRDDGLSYGDYLEQLTYLLFLKALARARGLRLAEPHRPLGRDDQP